VSKFTLKIQETRSTTKDDKSTDKPVSFTKLPSLITVKTSKEVKKSTKPTEKKDTEKSYAQALLSKISKILKIKKTFPKLQANKINNIDKIINGNSKPKPKLNMMIKSLFRKQVIIPISNENKAKFMKYFNTHITNLNRALKIIKLEVIADFIHMDQASVTIVTNKIILPLDLQIIEKYVKNANYINLDEVDTSHLPQSKSYLKIIGIPYLLENTNNSILADVVETIIKDNHIFNNITVALKP